MRVRIKLFASLRTGRFAEEERELPAGSRVLDAILAAGVPPSEVSVIFRNSRHAEPGDALAEGDSLGLFPPVGGG